MTTLIDTLRSEQNRATAAPTAVEVEDAEAVNSREQRADYVARRKIYPSGTAARTPPIRRSCSISRIAASTSSASRSGRRSFITSPAC
jgi:hypothetical protein